MAFLENKSTPNTRKVREMSLFIQTQMFLLMVFQLFESTKSNLGQQNKRWMFSVYADTTCIDNLPLNVGVVGQTKVINGEVWTVGADYSGGYLYLSRHTLTTNQLSSCLEIFKTIEWESPITTSRVTAIDYVHTVSTYLYFLVSPDTTTPLAARIFKVDMSIGGNLSFQNPGQMFISTLGTNAVTLNTLTKAPLAAGDLFVFGPLLHYVDPTMIGTAGGFSSFGDLNLYSTKAFNFLTCSSSSCFSIVSQANQASKLVSIDMNTLSALVDAEISVDFQGSVEPIIALRYLPVSSLMAACRFASTSKCFQ